MIGLRAEDYFMTSRSGLLTNRGTNKPLRNQSYAAPPISESNHHQPCQQTLITDAETWFEEYTHGNSQ